MEQKLFNLTALVDIRFGSNETTDPDGTVAFIMARNFNDDYSFTDRNLHFIKETQVKERALLMPMNILLAGKGNVFAVLWRGEIKPAVASGTFFVLSIKDNSIIPEFLTWYLNSDAMKKQIQEHIKTTTVPHITRSALDEIKITVPSIETQKKIVKIFELFENEKKLADQLVLKKEKLINSILT